MSIKIQDYVEMLNLFTFQPCTLNKQSGILLNEHTGKKKESLKEMERKHLILKALHRDSSFLSEGVERLIGLLKANNQQVEQRDLYDLHFDPVLTASDFEAAKAGNIPPDIAAEQNHIRNSDLLWFVYPVWWAGMPAILKGYIDRVFSSGFAYTMEDDKPKGLLVNKQAIILNSMGMSYEDYKESGMFGALDLTMDQGIFAFSGIQVLEHKYFSSIMSSGREEREKYYREIENLARRVVNETRMSDVQNKQKVA